MSNIANIKGIIVQIVNEQCKYEKNSISNLKETTNNFKAIINTTRI